MKVFTPTNVGADLVGALPQALTEAEAAAVPGVLGRIAAERVAAYRDTAYRDTSEVLGDVGRVVGRRSFADALRAPGVGIIAEVKRKSPSLGRVADLDPLTAAKAYEGGGAAALSILTEPNHFGGDLAHLEEVAAGVTLPLLRKDFTVHPVQLIEAKRAGASAVLLIVAVLKDHTEGYLTLAKALGLDALVEVHDERELDTALASGAELIGVNNRDLTTLSIDLHTAPRLMTRARDAGFKGVLVAESGYTLAEELGSVYGLADAVLVGSSVSGAPDLAAAVRELRLGLDGLGPKGPNRA